MSINLKETSIDDYDKMSLEEKQKFYLKIKNNNLFIPAIRQTKTRNMKERGFKQPNGKLTFIDELRRVDKKVTNFYYLCTCECGNWYILTNRHFDKEDSISCGCYKKQRGADMCKNILGPAKALNLQGQIFGDLEVLEKTDKRANDYKVIWRCKCINCRKEQEVQATMLNRGKRSFCEFCSQRKSKGERLISSLLEINNLPYKKEYSFEDCRFPNTNALAFFDFYVNNSYLIEFDGEQHFKPIRFYNISSEKAQTILTSTQIRDQYKNKWCKDNNIPLIRIPYTHLEKICLEDLLPETSKFII